MIYIDPWDHEHQPLDGPQTLADYRDLREWETRSPTEQARRDAVSAAMWAQAAVELDQHRQERGAA